MQLGKHVYVQKPLTHDIYEARILTEAAKNIRWLLKWKPRCLK
jgi:predicted dehydrogenase